jgi:hypothetical protein
LIAQARGILVNFPEEVMRLITISEGDRRGIGEGNDGWLDVNPITGE